MTETFTAMGNALDKCVVGFLDPVEFTETPGSIARDWATWFWRSLVLGRPKADGTFDNVPTTVLQALQFARDEQVRVNGNSHGYETFRHAGDSSIKIVPAK